jgi:hypothetical protein
MLVRPVSAERPGRRLSGGFTLDEAARLYRTCGGATPSVCPHCGGGLRDLTGNRPRGEVWLVRCETCGRGLVFDRPGGD